MIKKYYPLLWSRERVEALIDSGRLTKAEIQEAREILREEG